jgi:hypothetical protein
MHWHPRCVPGVQQPSRSALQMSVARIKKGGRGLQGEFHGGEPTPRPPRGGAGWHPLPPSGHSFSYNRGPLGLSMVSDRCGSTWMGTYLGFFPFLLFPLFSSPPLFLLSPVWAVLAHRTRGRTGASSGACSPGRQCSRVLACGQACGCVCGRCARPCRQRMYEAALIGSGWSWLLWWVVVVVGGKKRCGNS